MRDHVKTLLTPPISISCRHVFIFRRIIRSFVRCFADNAASQSENVVVGDDQMMALAIAVIDNRAVVCFAYAARGCQIDIALFGRLPMSCNRIPDKLRQIFGAQFIGEIDQNIYLLLVSKDGTAEILLDEGLEEIKLADGQPTERLDELGMRVDALLNGAGYRVSLPGPW